MENERGMKRLLIGIPMMRQMESSFVTCLFNRLNELIGTGKWVIKIEFCGERPLDFARETMSEKALEWKADKILFMDTDMVVQENVIPKLLEIDGDVVSPVYFKLKEESDGTRMMVFKIKKDMTLTADTVVDVDGVGFGCCVVDTKILSKLEKPWFKDDWNQPKEKRLSEDLYFCDKVKKAGGSVKLWVKKVGHQGALV